MTTAYGSTEPEAGFYDVDGFAVRIRAVCGACSLVSEGLWNGIGSVTCEQGHRMDIAGMGICRAPDLEAEVPSA